MNDLFGRIKQVYRLYDSCTAHIEAACEINCPDCCTINVTLTGLEGQYLLNGLSEKEKAFALDRLFRMLDAPRFRPLLSTNGYAISCREEEGASADENNPEWGRCPFLESGLCRVYEFRPFGCRAMISVHKCSDYGHADMDPYLLTLNTVFMQFIEHMDAGGFFGNLIDVLLLLSGKEDSRLVTAKNHPIPALMIPPEHRKDIAPVVNALCRIIENRM